MYLHAWKQGLKTTYYLRSRPATRITQTTTNGAVPVVDARLVCERDGLRLRHELVEALDQLAAIHGGRIPRPDGRSSRGGDETR